MAKKSVKSYDEKIDNYDIDKNKTKKTKKTTKTTKPKTTKTTKPKTTKTKKTTTSKTKKEEKIVKTTEKIEETKEENKDEKLKKEIESLDNSATTRIRVDKNRINDAESLDTSFLDNKRSEKKIKKEINDFSKTAEIDVPFKIKDKKEKESKSEKKGSKIKSLIIILLILLIFGMLLFGLKYLLDNKDKNKNKNNEKVKIKTKEVIKIDDNNIFLGDDLTSGYDLSNYFDTYVVNSGIDDDTTSDILDDLENRIYIYNPSKVFINIGINDLLNTKTINDIITNYKEIITSIKENRPYAEIYIESIYPVNKDIPSSIVPNKFDTSLIIDLNKELENLAKENEVKYINIYNLLVKGESLNTNYTEDGLHLNDNGYKIVTKVIKKYIR